jgi:hypothetical protein
MLGIKIALNAVGFLGGLASAVTGGILMAQHQAPSPLIAEATSVISDSTPITLALTIGGITASAGAAWVIRGIWDKIERRISRLEDQLKDLRGEREKERD